MCVLENPIGKEVWMLESGYQWSRAVLSISPFYLVLPESLVCCFCFVLFRFSVSLMSQASFQENTVANMLRKCILSDLICSQNLFRGPVYKDAQCIHLWFLCKSLKYFFLWVISYIVLSVLRNLRTNHNSEKVFFFF